MEGIGRKRAWRRQSGETEIDILSERKLEFEGANKKRKAKFPLVQNA